MTSRTALVAAALLGACTTRTTSDRLVAPARFARLPPVPGTTGQRYVVYTIDTYARSADDSPLTSRRRELARLLRDNAKTRLEIVDARIAAGQVTIKEPRDQKVVGDEDAYRRAVAAGTAVAGKPVERDPRSGAVRYWMKMPDRIREKGGQTPASAARAWADERARLVAALADAERAPAAAPAPRTDVGSGEEALTDRTTATFLDPPLDAEVEAALGGGAKIDGNACQECEKLVEGRRALMVRGSGDLSPVDLSAVPESAQRAGVTLTGDRLRTQSITDVVPREVKRTPGTRWVWTLKKSCAASVTRVERKIWRMPYSGGTISIPKSYEVSWLEMPRPSCWAADDASSAVLAAPKTVVDALELDIHNAEADEDYLRRTLERVRKRQWLD